MSDFDPSNMTTDQLIDHFAHNGSEQDKALLYDEFDDFRRLYDEMLAIKNELASRGREASLALLGLYGHKNMQVRLQAAAFSLAVAPIAGRNELQAIADSRFPPQNFHAKSLLRGLNDGTFKPT